MRDRAKTATTASLVLAGLAAITAAFVPGVASGQPSDRPVGAEVAELRRLVSPYQDVARAVADGYRPTEVCVPGMGFHYVNPQRVMAPLDEDAPPVLIYRAARGGGLELVAAEFFVADADQDLATDDDRPSLWGRPFQGPMAPHEPGMPVHYDLHVWTHLANPDGALTPENPRVRC